ncbi:MAG: hypothetical protein M1366_03635 [Patescibacteria group bacterium]|nr:hypothetical protein [Patescibacteria group bacterium]
MSKNKLNSLIVINKKSNAGFLEIISAVVLAVLMIGVAVTTLEVQHSQDIRQFAYAPISPTSPFAPPVSPTPDCDPSDYYCRALRNGAITQAPTPEPTSVPTPDCDPSDYYCRGLRNGVITQAPTPEPTEIVDVSPAGESGGATANGTSGGGVNSVSPTPDCDPSDYYCRALRNGAITQAPTPEPTSVPTPDCDPSDYYCRALRNGAITQAPTPEPTSVPTPDCDPSDYYCRGLRNGVITQAPTPEPTEIAYVIPTSVPTSFPTPACDISDAWCRARQAGTLVIPTLNPTQKYETCIASGGTPDTCEVPGNAVPTVVVPTVAAPATKPAADCEAGSVNVGNGQCVNTTTGESYYLPGYHQPTQDEILRQEYPALKACDSISDSSAKDKCVNDTLRTEELKATAIGIGLGVGTAALVTAPVWGPAVVGGAQAAITVGSGAVATKLPAIQEAINNSPYQINQFLMDHPGISVNLNRLETATKVTSGVFCVAGSQEACTTFLPTSELPEVPAASSKPAVPSWNVGSNLLDSPYDPFLVGISAENTSNVVPVIKDDLNQVSQIENETKSLESDINAAGLIRKAASIDDLKSRINEISDVQEVTNKRLEALNNMSEKSTQAEIQAGGPQQNSTTSVQVSGTDSNFSVNGIISGSPTGTSTSVQAGGSELNQTIVSQTPGSGNNFSVSTITSGGGNNLSTNVMAGSPENNSAVVISAIDKNDKLAILGNTGQEVTSLLNQPLSISTPLGI